MRIGITGASGFLGQHLARELNRRGHETVGFSRHPARPVPGCRETRAFLPSQPVDLWDLDAMANLAGESVLGFWTRTRRARILESRVGGTARTVQAIRGANLDRGGGFRLVNASATGFYGDRGNDFLEEDDAPGTGFLPDVCRQWEGAAWPAREAGVPVACVRIGFVLGRDGGAWPLLRRAFRLGLGGKLGGGEQWMPVVHVADVVGVLVALLEHEEAENPDAGTGVFNAVCPQPVRNRDFTRAVAAALHRPAFLPAPAALLRRTLGDLSHVMLDSQRVLPTRTQDALGYEFRFPNLGAMLADVAKA